MGCKCEFQKSGLLANEFSLKNSFKGEMNTKEVMNSVNVCIDNNNKYNISNIPSDLNVSLKKDHDNPHNYSTANESIPPNGRDSIDGDKVFYYINKVRETPRLYYDKILKYKSMIIRKNNRYYLTINNKTFINLNQGPEAFTSALEFIDKQKQLPQYKLSNELCLPFPFFNPSIAVQNNYLQVILFEKAKELKDSYDIISFHYDQMIYGPELAVVLQVIDDTNSGFIRRKNIFLNNAEYIGISGGKVNQTMYCVYYLFANKRNK